MDIEETKKRLEELHEELFKTANSLACAEYGKSAMFLHESANNLYIALKVLNGEDVSIPGSFIMRSMGLDF